ncbi:Yip1 family protein [Neobacillus sp. OS1-2]|uniref:Yip1 family protein n=1 Tax=Neobacillus sp. OS1-2 TaxID=3070680 RepID=UPI0027E065A3|nr:Yip1 family protein [Neobacillus sp. OS1-2]WML41607.1 Yip1 family protein [Neobacillus sp. OS1-2]
METVVKEKVVNVEKPSIFGMIAAPTLQFERMKEKAPIALPLIIMLILTGITGAIVAYVGLNNPIFNDLPTPIEIPAAFTVGMGTVGAVIGGVARFFIVAAFYKLCMVFMGNDTPYMKLFAVVLYSSLIMSVGVLINGLISLAVGGYEVYYTSIAPLMGDNQMLKLIASNFDIFHIWYYVVLGMGLRVVAGLSKGKVITLVVIIFLLGVALSSLGGLVPTLGA